jgi:hypothetical protein
MALHHVAIGGMETGAWSPAIGPVINCQRLAHEHPLAEQVLSRQRRRAVLSLTIATRGVSGVSCGVNRRPRRNGTCIVSKSPGVAAW